MTGLEMLLLQPLTMVQFLVQRQVTRPALREAAASAVAALRPRASQPRPGPEATRIREALAQDGFCRFPKLVGPRRAAEMRDYFDGFEVIDPYHPALGAFRPEHARPETHIGHFEPQVVLNAPHAVDIANDDGLLDAVASALGAKPKIAYMAAWWSVPHGDTPREAENFHRDVDDWRFIKLFVYLTDVDQNSGPHSFVRGSHRSRKLSRIQRYTDEAVENAFGLQRVEIFQGAAGSALLENTYGLHRGVPPVTRPRLIFQVVYGLSRMPYGPPRPICDRKSLPGGSRLDPYVNGVYLS